MKKENTRLKGHELIGEGKPLGMRRWGTGGIGVAGCSCGARSPEFDSGAKRKQWHREHKEEMRKAVRDE